MADDLNIDEMLADAESILAGVPHPSKLPTGASLESFFLDFACAAETKGMNLAMEAGHCFAASVRWRELADLAAKAHDL